MEDNCPKCRARIKAPLPEPEPAAEPAPASAAEPDPSKFKHSILDAVLHAPEPARAPRPARSQEPLAAPEARESSRSDLLDEFLSTAPIPPMEPAVGNSPANPPRSKATNAGDPGPAAKIQPQAPLPPPVMPAPEGVPTAAAALPTLREITKAAEPTPFAPAQAPERESQPPPPVPESPQRSDPGIGLREIIAKQPGLPTPNASRQIVPSLGVGLMQVEDGSKQHENHRRRRTIVTGILVFLLFDAVLVGWIFRQRILEWWHEQPSPAVAQQPRALPSSNRSPAPTAQPQGAPRVEPEKPVPTVDAPPPAKIAESPPPDNPEVASPVVAATVGGPLPAEPRKVGDVPGKKEFSAAQIGAPLAPPSIIPDPLQSPLLTPTAKELLTTLDVPLLTIPKQPETPAAGADDLNGKTEMKPPQSPPSPPQVAALPEAAGKPAAPEAAAVVPAAAAVESPHEPAKIVETGIIPAARSALAALKNFLAAPTWQERLRWVQKPETVKAAMEKHYRRHFEGPVNVARIDFIERYPARSGNPPYCMFELNGGDLKSTILVLVEEKSRGDFRVDWEAFVEFKDRLLREFLGKAGSPPGKFRVMIRRNHSFDKSVPDLDRKDSFELSQPGLDTIANAYAIKGATVSRALSQQLGWGESIAVTVQLAWRSEGSRSWVEVTAVPTFGWRG